jgi:hypothetical protein
MEFLYPSIEQILHSKPLLLRSVNDESFIHTRKKRKKNIRLFIWVVIEEFLFYYQSFFIQTTRQYNVENFRFKTIK